MHIQGPILKHVVHSWNLKAYVEEETPYFWVFCRVVRIEVMDLESMNGGQPGRSQEEGAELRQAEPGLEIPFGNGLLGVS